MPLGLGAGLRPLRFAWTNGLHFSYSGILTSGQSKSVGTHGVPVISTTQTLGNVQLHDSGGTYANPASGTWSTIPLIAPVRADKYLNDQNNTSQYPTNINGESVDVTMANALAVMTGAKFLTSCVGEASASYTIIGKGGTGNAYQSLLNEATVATGLGIGYGGAFATLTHGETDFQVTIYDRFLTAYQSELETDVKAITGQTQTIPLIINQMNSYPPGGTTSGNVAGPLQLRATQEGISAVKTEATVAFNFGPTSAGTLTGNGSVSTTIQTDTSTTRVLGLVHTYTGTSYTTAWDYALVLTGNIPQVYESGAFRGSFGTFVSGDVLSINIASNVVTYQKNGVTFYTSLNAPTFPLFCQVTMNQQWVALHNLTMTGGTLGTWSHLTNGVMTDSSNVLLSGPEYYLPFYSLDRIHLTTQGYQMLGEQYARTAYRYLNGGWTTFAPTAVTRSGYVATITFAVPTTTALVWDGTHTAPHQSGTYASWASGNGFEALDANGNIATISGVAIVGSNQVQITCTVPPNTIAYAHTPDSTVINTGGFPDGRCGLLHDSDTFVGPITGVAQFNWCPEFSSTTQLVTDVPTSVTGCTCWLRADRGVTIGTGVSAWADQSGSGDPNKNVTQATGAKQPTRNLTDAAYNNQATLSFASASQQCLQSAAWAASLAEPETIFIVGNLSGVAASEPWVDGGAIFERLLYNWSGTTELAGYAGAGPVGSGVALSASPIVGAFEFNGASSKVYVSAVTAKATGNAGNSGPRTKLTVGAFGDLATGFNNGKIAEVIIFNRILTADERAYVMKYLGARYAITIGA